jgi:hypothetical protein
MHFNTCITYLQCESCTFLNIHKKYLRSLKQHQNASGWLYLSAASVVVGVNREYCKYRVDSSFNKSEGAYINKYRVGGLQIPEVWGMEGGKSEIGFPPLTLAPTKGL